MSSFPFRDPVIFDWHSAADLVHVWEDYPPALSPDLLVERPRPALTGKTGYPLSPLFPAPASAPSLSFPYASTQFSPPIAFSYDNGAEASLDAEADPMLLEPAPRQELPMSPPPPVKPASLPVVEMVDAAPQESQTILLVKDEGAFRSKKPLPPTADDHPTSAMGDEDADYMDEEPSSHSSIITRSKHRSSLSSKPRRRRLSEGDSEDFVVSTERDDEDEVSGPTNDAAHPMKPNALTAEEQEECDQVHLGASKSPIMQALVYCALRGWGLRLIKNEGDDVRFTVDDFAKYYRCSAYICAKQNPTDDQSSRIKALKRWFPDFPTRREHETLFDTSFDVHVQRGKDNKPKKMRLIIDEVKSLIDGENRAKARKRIR